MTTPIIIAFGTILSDATVGLGYGFNLTQYGECKGANWKPWHIRDLQSESVLFRLFCHSGLKTLEQAEFAERIWDVF